MLWFLQRRDETICPAVCYGICNNAYLAAQKVGKTPELCKANSTFQVYNNGCNRCIESNLNSTTADSTQVYLDPKFSQFIDFCLLNDPSWETAPPITSQPSKSVPQTVMVQTVTFKLPNGKTALGAATVTVDIPYLSILPDSTTLSSPSTSPSQTLLATPSTTLFSSSQASSSPPSTPTATIAGATVGGLVGLIAILGLIIFYMRRNKKRNEENIESQRHEIDGQHRAQLHGDSIEPKEMSTQANTAEMEGNYGIYYEDPSKPGYLVPLQAQVHPVELYGSGIEQLVPLPNDVVPSTHEDGERGAERK